MIAPARRLAVVLGTAAAVGAFVLAGPAPAQAHASLLRTTPANGATLTAPPAEVVLTFDEPPIALGTKVQVTGPGGTASLGSARIVDASVHQALRQGLPVGVYRVAWRVTSDDGHPVSDTFSFTVSGTGAASTPTSSTATAGTPATSTPTGSATAAGTPAASKTLHSSGVSAPLLWGVVVAVLLIIAAAIAAVRTRRPNQEKS